nr:MAG TPA: hypothetical protein [Caudoviricetes sp.]
MNSKLLTDNQIIASSSIMGSWLFWFSMESHYSQTNS